MNLNWKKWIMPLMAIFLFTAIASINLSIDFNSGQYKASLFEDEFLRQARNDSISADQTEDREDADNYHMRCDVLVAGGGAGGTAAAIQAARMGAKTCLIEETDWLGGMLSSAGVSAIDGMPDTPSGIFREFINRLKEKYRKLNQSESCTVSYFCFEPSIANEVLQEMVKETPNLSLFLNSKIDRVYREKNTIKGVRMIYGNNIIVAEAKVTVDATEYGDLMYMANIPFDLGVDTGTKEPHLRVIEDCIQPITYVAVLEKKVDTLPVKKPADYDLSKYSCVTKNELCPDSTSKFTPEDILNYGLLPNNKLMINIPSHSFGNDFDASTDILEPKNRQEVLEQAKEQTLGLIYFLQDRGYISGYGFSGEFKTEDHMAKIPYIRESRRLRGMSRMLENDILPDANNRSKLQKDSIAIGDYPIDLHFCTTGVGDVYYEIPPYQIPYGVTVPEKVDGFMVAEKNISVSHIVNGTTRLQPVVMSVGQAVGTAAAIASIKDIEPRQVSVQDIQEQLLKSGSRIYYFKDMTEDHYAYPYVVKLALNGVVRGYSDLSFKPDSAMKKKDLEEVTKNALFLYDNTVDNTSLIDNLFDEIESEYVTRGQFAKVVTKAIPYFDKLDDASQYNFRDVPFDSNYYTAVSKLLNADVISKNNQKFRPDEKITRAEAMTMIVRSIGYF